MYLIGNWKQNLTINDLPSWYEEFTGTSKINIPSGKVNVIVATSYVLLYPSFQLIKDLGVDITLASQDVSEYPSGSHTGEVGVFQLSDLVKYAVLGHSERRTQGESNEQVIRKAKLCLEHEVKPVVCFSSIDELISIKESVINIDEILLAYEPLEAIGTGHAASVSDIYDFYKRSGLNNMIYGGSVDKDTIQPYLELDFLNGFLVGGASLDPTAFKAIFDLIDKRV